MERNDTGCMERELNQIWKLNKIGPSYKIPPHPLRSRVIS